MKLIFLGFNRSVGVARQMHRLSTLMLMPTAIATNPMRTG